MNDPDVLTRAAKALRSAHTGEREGSGFTRARIMTTLHGKRRRRLLHWAVFSPLASLVLVGSAWAHSAGKWPVVWQAVTSVFAAGPPRGEVAAPKASVPAPPNREAPSMAERPLPEPPPPSEQAPSAEAPPSDALSPPDDAVAVAGERLEPPRASSRRRSEPKPALRRATGPAIDAPRTSPGDVEGRAPADPELSKFRRAHDLHFRAGSPHEAIAAYAAYLEEFPNGRFVPEARYNTALNWIKLGDKAAARVALAPFAKGVHGEYRRAEARELLEALK